MSTAPGSGGLGVRLLLGFRRRDHGQDRTLEPLAPALVSDSDSRIQNESTTDEPRVLDLRPAHVGAAALEYPRPTG